MFLWLTGHLKRFSKTIAKTFANIKRRIFLRHKSAVIIKPIPREKIEQVKKVKSDREKLREAKRIKIIMRSLCALAVLILAATVVFAVYQMKNSDNVRFTWFDEFFGRTPDSAVSEETSSSEVSVISEISDDSYLLLLANKSVQMPEDYQPKITEFSGIKIDERAVDALSEMINAAESQSVSLSVSKGYVSPDEQEQIYSEKYNSFIASGYSKVKAEEEAQMYKPGYSDFNIGLSVEFSNSDAFSWLSENCVSYGFIQRYPAEKERKTGASENKQIFRFVGKDNAVRMRQLGMCLEEYADFISKQ